MQNDLIKIARARRLAALASLEDAGSNVISLERRRNRQATVTAPTVFISYRSPEALAKQAA